MFGVGRSRPAVPQDRHEHPEAPEAHHAAYDDQQDPRVVPAHTPVSSRSARKNPRTNRPRQPSATPSCSIRSRSGHSTVCVTVVDIIGGQTVAPVTARSLSMPHTVGLALARGMRDAVSGGARRCRPRVLMIRVSLGRQRRRVRRERRRVVFRRRLVAEAATACRGGMSGPTDDSDSAITPR